MGKPRMSTTVSDSDTPTPPPSSGPVPDRLRVPLAGSASAAQEAGLQPPDAVPPFTDSDADFDGLDVEDAVPTNGADGHPVGVARGQTSDHGDEPSKPSFDPQSLRLAREEAERRWPDLAADPDWHLWIDVQAGKSSVLDLDAFQALARRLDKKQAAMAKPDTAPDYAEALETLQGKYPKGDEDDRVLVARWLSHDSGVDSGAGTAALQRLEVANPDRPADAAISELSEGSVEDAAPDGPTSEELEAEWFSFLHVTFGITGYAPRPHSQVQARMLIDQRFPGVPDGYRTAFVLALMGEVMVRVDDGRGEVELTAERVERWAHEARAEIDLANRIDVIAEERVTSNLPGIEAHVRSQLAADLEPWHRTGAGIFVIVAVILGAVVFLVMGIMDMLDERSYQARLDKAAADVPMFYNTEGQLDDAEDMAELREKTGFSADPAVREVEVLTGLSSHEARLSAIEDRDAELARQRDQAQGELVLESHLRTVAEAAALDSEELIRQQQAEHELQLRELRAETRRRGRLLDAASVDVEAARILYKEHVQAGRCGDPMDEAYPNDPGLGRSHFQCSFGVVVCDGRLPSEATDCKLVKDR